MGLQSMGYKNGTDLETKPPPNNREGTQPHPSTENWIKDLLSMAPPIRKRPSSPQASLVVQRLKPLPVMRETQL